MAIQYYMRAFNTSLSAYVDWVVNDTPDSTGAFSGYPTNQLIDITVNRVVQSKVANFLKQNQSLGGTDGYYFHVNSYDWRNATAPILPPTNLVGMAIERGITAVVSVTGASNASPINITTSAPHGLVTGQIVTITGVTSNTAANGTWPIVVTGSSNFQLVGSSGNGPSTVGGNVFIPTSFSTLTWDETNSLWRFVVNTNGDGTTLGASQSVKVNNFFIDGYLALGSPTATAGIIRLPNNQYIDGYNTATGGSTQLLGLDTSNRIKLGSLSTDITYFPGFIQLDGYIQHTAAGVDGTNVASVGFIREQNNTTIIAFRAQSLLSDVVALSSNSTNNVILGDAANAGIFYNTSTGSVHQFQVNTAPQFEIGTAFTRFTSAVVSPLITQTTPGAGISGQNLTVQSQNAGAGGANGGNLTLTSGTGAANGTVNLQTGGVTRVTISDTAETLSVTNLNFASTVTSPLISQITTAGASAQAMTVQAQNSSAGSGNGGNLVLTSGTGSSTIGQTLIQTGGTTQIIVSPTTIPPGSTTSTTGSVIIRGNLEVVGTTTTVDSTVVDIIGRVIHANWADPVASPNVAVPSQIVGYSVHRGNSSGIARDGAAWIWTEGAQASGSDGYWRAQTDPGDGYGTDNFTAANSTTALNVMGSSFSPTTDPNPVTGTLPGIGGVRLPNNVAGVVARNVTPVTTIAAASNLTTLPQATINVASTTGFSSPSGTLLVFSDAGVQTVTYTNTTGTSFTGGIGGTGLIHTGAFVAQTNKSTTFNGSNGTALPAASITVASTVGFPASGTLRIVSHLFNSASAPLSVQTITYTGGGGAGTTFTGCTGGTGFLFVGDSITSLPITGNGDLSLVGTDFGNRVLWGSPSNLNGHIFNTPTGTFYEMQVNSVDQIRIGQADIEADGYAEVFEIGPTIVNPRLYQLAKPDTGASAGNTLFIQAQNGQNQTGATTNNNGGNLVLASGTAGTGGTTATGFNGEVDIQTDGNIKIRVFPIFAPNAADSNTLFIDENIIRIGPTQNVPLIRQDSTTNANGQSFTLQAQNAATRGGPLLLQSGTGPGSLDGYVNILTGTTVKATFFPTFAISAADNNSILLFENKLRFDLGQSVPLIRQDDQTAGSTNGQSLTLQAQNATGVTSNGGPLQLKSGTGSQFDGYVDIITGSTLKARFNPTFATSAADSNTLQLFENIVRFDSTMNVPLIRQDTTGGASGQSLTLQAQNAATTGGPLLLTSGTGATNDGYINLITGSTVKMTIFPTTAVSAANNNSILVFENKFRFDTAQSTPLIRQDDVTTNSATGQSFTIQAQNATGTTSLGGDGYFTSGTGTTQAGNIHIQTGGVDKIITHPSFTEFRDTAEALRITPVSAGTTQITFASTVTAAQINQSDLTTASGVGATMTIQAQNETGTTSAGGQLRLSSGTGTSNAGNVIIQSGGVNKFVVQPTFMTFMGSAAAEALRITPVSNGTTEILFAKGVTSAVIDQTAQDSGAGSTMTIHAQDGSTTGGDLNLTSGSGTTDGYLHLQAGAGASTVVTVHTNKVSFNKGWRRHVTSVTGTYQVLVTDDYLAITTLAAPFTITMPASPVAGDTYTIKDAVGNAATNNVTIAGNGNNIDGASTAVLSQNFTALVLTYTGTQWSIT